MKTKRLAIAAMFMLLASCRTENDSAERSPRRTARTPALDQPPYLGQQVPGLMPERFAPGIVSTPAIELNGVFSADQQEFYFTRVVDGVDTMYQISFVDGKLEIPKELLLLPNQTRAEAERMAQLVRLASAKKLIPATRR